MPKNCIFCSCIINQNSNSKKRSREHVFANWILNEFGLQNFPIEFSRFETITPTGASLQVTEQTPFRKLNLGNFLLGNVCSGCNHGWMSELEGATKPQLQKLISNTSGTISKGTKAIFAKWAMKTAFVLRAYLDPPVARIPQRHAQTLVGSKKDIPKGVSVFHRQSAIKRIHFAIAQTWVIEAEVMNKIVEEKFKNSYKYVFQIGHAQFLVQFFPDDRATLRFNNKFCNLLESSHIFVSGSDVDPSDSGITDDLFLFALSNTVAISSNTSLPKKNDLCICGSGIKYKKCCSAPNVLQKRAPDEQGWTGSFLTSEEFEAKFLK